jgi:hypothetical protein
MKIRRAKKEWLKMIELIAAAPIEERESMVKVLCNNLDSEEQRAAALEEMQKIFHNPEEVKKVHFN